MDILKLLQGHTLGVAMQVVAALLALKKGGGGKTVVVITYKRAQFRVTIERV